MSLPDAFMSDDPEVAEIEMVFSILRSTSSSKLAFAVGIVKKHDSSNDAVNVDFVFNFVYCLAHKFAIEIIDENRLINVFMFIPFLCICGRQEPSVLLSIFRIQLRLTNKKVARNVYFFCEDLTSVGMALIVKFQTETLACL